MGYAENATPSVILQILTVFFGVVTLLAYFARILTKLLAQRKSPENDDYLLTAAMVFALAQSTFVVVSAIHGLGLPENSRPPEQVNLLLQTQYASTLFWFSSMCCSRLAYLSLVRIMTPVAKHRSFINDAFMAVIFWTVLSLFVSAFQCDLPTPWTYVNGGHCINRTSWFVAHDIIDVILDTILIALPTTFIFSLQAAKLSVKLEAAFYFWLRLFVVGATITHAVLWSSVRYSNDLIADIWPVTVCAEAMQALSIVSVSALYLKHFVKMLQTGFLRLDDAQRRGSNRTESRVESQVLSYVRRAAKHARKGRANGRGQTLGTLNEISAAHHVDGVVWDQESQHSTAQFIHAETTFRVESEPRRNYDEDPARTHELLAKPLPHTTSSA